MTPEDKDIVLAMLYAKHNAAKKEYRAAILDIISAVEVL